MKKLTAFLSNPKCQILIICVIYGCAFAYSIAVENFLVACLLVIVEYITLNILEVRLISLKISHNITYLQEELKTLQTLTYSENNSAKKYLKYFSKHDAWFINNFINRPIYKNNIRLYDFLHPLKLTKINNDLLEFICNITLIKHIMDLQTQLNKSMDYLNKNYSVDLVNSFLPNINKVYDDEQKQLIENFISQDFKPCDKEIIAAIKDLSSATNYISTSVLVLNNIKERIIAAHDIAKELLISCSGNIDAYIEHKKTVDFLKTKAKNIKNLDSEELVGAFAVAQNFLESIAVEITIFNN